MAFKKSDVLVTNEFKEEYIKELFRSLRTKIQLSLHQTKDKSLIITSHDPEAGKSTISANLSISLAQQSYPTVLIDGDMRLGTIHELFGIDRPEPGLSEILASDEPVTSTLLKKNIRAGTVKNLYIIPRGTDTHISSELLASKRFAELKSVLHKHFKYIIFDSPPIGMTSDSIIVDRYFSKYLIIVKAGATNVVDLKKKLSEYPSIKEKIIGTVLNYATLDKKLNYYKYSKYYKATNK